MVLFEYGCALSCECTTKNESAGNGTYAVEWADRSILWVTECETPEIVNYRGVLSCASYVDKGNAFRVYFSFFNQLNVIDNHQLPRIKVT